MNDQLTTVVTSAFTLITGIVVGVFLGEPIKRIVKRFLDKREEIWDRRAKVAQQIELRPRFRVTQVCDPDSAFDFSSVLKEQNRNQEIVLIEVDDFPRVPGMSEIAQWKNLTSKREFLDRVCAMLARTRGETWQGLSGQQADVSFKRRREIVITNIPIPGNFYGWNSKDRNYLLISTAPIERFFVEEGPTIDDFILRVTQRMTAFSLSPHLDPIKVHTGTSAGCLFDFNVRLQSIVHVVRAPHICGTCAASIVEDQGDEFFEGLSKWITVTSKISL